MEDDHCSFAAIVIFAEEASLEGWDHLVPQLPPISRDYWRPHEAGLHANEDGCDIDLVQDDQSWNIEDSDKRLPIGNVPIAAWGTSLKRTGIPTSLTRPQNRYESGLASRRLGYCMRLSRMSDGDRPLNDDGDDAHS